MPRFTSLYRYSTGKAPSDLRPAIVSCRLALAFALFAALLFIAATVLTIHQPASHEQVNPTSDNQTSSTLIDNSSNTFTINDNELIKISVISCLIVGVLLIIAGFGALFMAHFIYRRYVKSRMVSYERVNRTFDRMQQRQRSKVMILEPIAQCSQPVVIQVNERPSSRLAQWARAKLKLSYKPTNSNLNNNSYHMKTISKKMTI